MQFEAATLPRSTLWTTIRCPTLKKGLSFKLIDMDPAPLGGEIPDGRPFRLENVEDKTGKLTFNPNLKPSWDAEFDQGQRVGVPILIFNVKTGSKVKETQVEVTLVPTPVAAVMYQAKNVGHAMGRLKAECGGVLVQLRGLVWSVTGVFVS